jgi:hypothetical protein
MISRTVIFLLCLVASTASWAHKAKLDKYGCHKSKAQQYHCHEGILKGEQFRDQFEMLKEKHARERAGSTGPR